jgi:hypothetical protein
VSEGDSATEHVDLGRVKLENFDASELEKTSSALICKKAIETDRNGAEGLVDLPAGDLILCEARALESDGDGEGRGNGEVDGVGRGIGEGWPKRQSGQRTRTWSYR